VMKNSKNYQAKVKALDWWTCIRCGYVTESNDADCPRCGEGRVPQKPSVWMSDEHCLVVCDERPLEGL